MEPTCRIRRPLWLAMVAAGYWLSAAQIAGAHSINVFAYVENGAIHGEVFARGGTPIAGATITAHDPGGAKLGETKTDAEGKFSLAATKRCAWRLVADAGEGHQAEYTVPSDELPADLPGGEDEPSEPARAEASLPSAPPEAAEETGDGRVAGQLAGLERQLIALRRDLEQLRHRLRFQDIVGGIGYILGLMGLAYYFRGAGRRDRNPPDA